MRKAYTLVMLIKNDKLLLGRKKRGFGAGKWNGFGGKVESGETIEQAARRELLEESGLVAGLLEPAAQLNFTFDESEDIMEVHVYKCSEFSGETSETEEMEPRWFSLTELPYDQMWTDDRYWLPRVLANERLYGEIHFSSDEKTIKNCKLINI